MQKNPRFSGLAKQDQQKGFTLVELITVVAIIALLVVYITVEIGTTNDDAKVGISNTFFLGNVPAAIGAYKSRHANTCNSLNGLTAAQVTQQLIARGLISMTPWQDNWTAAYDGALRRLIITFPTTASDNAADAANDIVSSLITAPQVHAVYAQVGAAVVAAGTAAGGASLTAPGHAAPAAVAGAGSVVAEYDCI